MKLFVKICGVRTLEDALACAEAGADAIGFNFWPGSKRYLPVDEAAQIARKLPPNLRTVGVFVDAPKEEVDRAFASGAIDLAQFHGYETPDYCRHFGGRYIKAVRLRNQSSIEQMKSYPCDILLVDAGTEEFGGSGQRAEPALARAAVETRRRVILAGGLNAGNVADAVRELRPYGVDVASGVERAPGVKDRFQIAAFLAAAKGVIG